ncbi:MAG: DUF6017 domain-containing protein [Lachnospiraceae bacterium]|nr:DUF6017 domain-containing protein [Lachnospiraceae bacterium]
MYIAINPKRIDEISHEEIGRGTSGPLVQKLKMDKSYDVGQFKTPESAQTQDPAGGGTKFCRTSHKTLYDPLQKNVTPLAKECRDLPQNDVSYPALDRGTNTENTPENTDEEHLIHLSREGGAQAGAGTQMDEMDRMSQCAEDYRKLIFENTHYEWHMEHDNIVDRKEYAGLVEMICDVVCAKHSKPVYVNSTAMPPEVVKSRFLKLTDDHIEYVMECLKKNQNHSGIENLRNYKLTCLYNAPVTMDSYYQQRANHDMYGS